LRGLQELTARVKKALRGDLSEARSVIEMLEGAGLSIFRAAAYLLVYQVAMNSLMDLSEECRKCGGKCCRLFKLIQLEDIDVKDLVESLGAQVLNILAKDDQGNYYIETPCPFQKGWLCSIHRFKPYACLSYPFLDEDLQFDVVMNYDGIDPPAPNIPSFCLAASKAWTYILEVIERYRRDRGKSPSPIELLELLKKFPNAL